jgi:hypothetical protein
MHKPHKSLRDALTIALTLFSVLLLFIGVMLVFVNLSYAIGLVTPPKPEYGNFLIGKIIIGIPCTLIGWKLLKTAIAMDDQ